jgi:hypothetical protein
MTKYMKWLSSLGEAAISPMNPLAHTNVVNPDGSVTEGGVTAMSGYTLIEADTIDSAIEMTKNCLG